ncbi:FUSC family protein [Streptomyces sp. TG1A-8]|uniref:FUSC family protein n=1 Tax=Streptomyces sp. TG1A-8 TaxID=3051385 RepID=UPI00265C1BE0|nr:FUSC family protein [Streptomyces sp. TG1A-8]MDO0928207.1 FUSC family protein [Streptomyces sp. TG1A-8]
MSRPAASARSGRRTAGPPPWLAHALRAQRGPVPWSAVVRGGLAAGPLLLAGVLGGRSGLGIMAAIGAMLAGINDRPGSRRASVTRLGVPALAGALGLLVGTYGGQQLSAVPLTLLLTVLGLAAGSVSAVGPVASAAGTQLLVTAAFGAGMALPDTGWQRVLAFLAGAGWLLALRLVLPTPGSIAGDFRFDGERRAVADVYEAVAALLDAVGGAGATARRAALTAALDHAQDTLAGPRLRRYASSAAERRLHAQYAAALPLAEAATALAWAGEPVCARAVHGPRRLAAAVRGNTGTGPLPAPNRSAPALRALDDALLRAAEAFDRAEGAEHRLLARRRSARSAVRAALGAGGREYGLRVALCFGASAAIAQALHQARWYGHQHWYWLPATAVFLVKPDLGPLASRVLCRAAGTVLGALVSAGLAPLLPRPAGVIALVAVCGALLPVAVRHFAALTAVVTVLVLALVMAGGERQAAAGRIGETLLACALVLVVGHLPMPGRRGGGVRARLAAAGSAAHAYLAHVLSESGDRAERWALRREAYRTLAEARTAIAVAAAELPALARHTEGADAVAAVLERLVDTTTACAVHLDDTGRLGPRHVLRLHEALDALEDQRARTGLPTAA